jgi:hypothetical protein
MIVATTIQLTREEDLAIAGLKKKLGLASKRAVVMEGVRSLMGQLEERQRRGRLQKASALVREGSRQANRQWAPLSSALTK